MTYEDAIRKRQIPRDMSRAEYDEAMLQQQAQIGQSPGLMNSIHDPWGGQGIQTADVRIIDRWLTVKGMPEIQDGSYTPFIFSADLIEQMEQLTLTDKSYK